MRLNSNATDAASVNVVTAAELRTMQFEPMRWVLPDYITEESVTLLVGRPKIGKSWLMLNLALACASSGGDVLGSMPPHGDVLYLALEDGNRRLQRRIDKILLPFNGAWPPSLTFVPMGSWPRADQGGLDKIEDWCASAAHPVLVLIDTLARFRKFADGKQQLYAADTEAIASLQKIAVKFHLAIVVGHHDRKAEADDDFDTVSGTLGLTGAADTVMLLKRKPHGVILSVRGRDVEERETAMHFDKATWRWTILGEASVVRRSVERNRVIAAIAERGGSASVSEIMPEVELNRNALDLLLGRMVRHGEIVRIGRGKYARPGQHAEAGQIGQKERSDSEAIASAGQPADLSNVSDLSMPEPLSTSKPLGENVADDAGVRRNEEEHAWTV
jgi:hypothetical protein